jgi:hypothetical protein
MNAKLAFAAFAALTLAACSKEATPPPPPPPAPPVAAAPPPAAEPAPAPASAPAVAPTTAPSHATRAEPAKAAKVAAPAAGTTPVYTAVRGKVGDAKCRMCHKLQHDSWSASPHAKKGLDCEGCHGGGSDFTKVMRDRTAAIAAGLILPKKEFCQKCHEKDWQDAMLMRVHAHKVK